jgi:hypothetical protein
MIFKHEDEEWFAGEMAKHGVSKHDARVILAGLAFLLGQRVAEMVKAGIESEKERRDERPFP